MGHGEGEIPVGPVEPARTKGSNQTKIEDESDCVGAATVIEDSSMDNIPPSTARGSCLNCTLNDDAEINSEQFECSKINPNTIHFECISSNAAADFDEHIRDMEEISNSCSTSAALDSRVCKSLTPERSAKPYEITSLRANVTLEREDLERNKPGAFHVSGRAPGQFPAWALARITSHQTQREIWNSSRSMQSNRNSESIEQAITDEPVAVAVDRESLERFIRQSIVDNAARAVLVSPQKDNCKNSINKRLCYTLIYANLVTCILVAIFWIVDALHK